MRKRKAAITWLSIIVAAVIILFIFAVVPMNFGGGVKWNAFLNSIKLGIDLEGGVTALYGVADDEENRADLTSRVESTAKRLEALLFGQGYMEAKVTTEGGERIRIEVPSVENDAELFKILGEPADLRFQINGITRVWGKDVTDAFVVNQQGAYAVQLALNAKGSADFFDATSENVGGSMDIVINGRTISSPNIESAIAGGRPVITGSFTFEQADTLAKQILSGAMPIKLTLLSSGVISAELGDRALSLSLLAAGIGILLIMAYLVFYYRGMGLLTCITLIAYVGLLLSLLAILPWVQLSLPGIAGIILSIGMAFDANIIIFERIMDEYRIGKSINAAIAAGLKKTVWTILDANITSVITAIILIILGRGAIMGFGITFLVGLIISLVLSLGMLRGLFKLVLRINKTSAKFYGLRRSGDIDELPDIIDSPKAKRERKKLGEVANEIG